MTPASVHDTILLNYCNVYSRHNKRPIEKEFADKAYAGKPNRDFFALNNIADGIMRKDSTIAKLTQLKMFKEHLLRILPRQADYEIDTKKNIYPVKSFLIFI